MNIIYSNILPKFNYDSCNLFFKTYFFMILALELELKNETCSAFTVGIDLFYPVNFNI